LNYTPLGRICGDREKRRARFAHTTRSVYVKYILYNVENSLVAADMIRRAAEYRFKFMRSKIIIKILGMDIGRTGFAWRDAHQH
jgi:hypothetical protein